ncbi:MAG: hypothetical protein Q3M24_22030 [Candidatus Electrothrix aestuarii]|uniref:Sigma-70 family RNA polymerase sigma factor n=1 Tax=Candidatus Electrothrix aestuarii TaxID=3062594 RepID=A0AAU8LV85_9BACT|nr:hypothetical protein [Candidatus Electrothrix aestuarii]
MKIDNKYDLSVREELDKVNWDSVLPKVLKCAIQVSRKFFWLGYKVNPEDLVSEAIARAYGVGTGGTYRNWNKKSCPDIAKFLNDIIKSMSSHTAEHEAKFAEESIFSEDGYLKNNKLFAIVDTIAGYCRPKTPEEKFIETDNLQKLVNVLDKLENENEDLGMVILCIKEGISEPRYIAQETGFDVSKVYNLLKKLRRKLKDFDPKKQKALC